MGKRKSPQPVDRAAQNGSSKQRLSIGAPAIAGLLVIATSLAVGMGAAFVPMDRGMMVAGVIVADAASRPVVHGSDGVVGRLLVRNGQQVEAGQVLMTLDTSAIDAEIAALKAQAETMKAQLETVRAEVRAYRVRTGEAESEAGRPAALEARLAAVEKDSSWLASRIANAEQKLPGMEINAPVAGTVIRLAALSAGAAFPAGATLLEIVPRENPVAVEGRIAAAEAQALKAGMRAEARLGSTRLDQGRTYPGKLVAVTPDSGGAGRSADNVLVRLESSEARADAINASELVAGRPVQIVVMTGQWSLLEMVSAPVMRAIDRAWRG